MNRALYLMLAALYAAALLAAAEGLLYDTAAAVEETPRIEVQFAHQEERLHALSEQLRDLKRELSDIKEKFNYLVIAMVLLAFFAGVNSLESATRFILNRK